MLNIFKKNLSNSILIQFRETMSAILATEDHTKKIDSIYLLFNLKNKIDEIIFVITSEINEKEKEELSEIGTYFLSDFTQKIQKDYFGEYVERFIEKDKFNFANDNCKKIWER